MWLADNWSDYALLDCSHGERLESWGPYHVVRPDPQAVWKTPRRHARWETPDARYVRSDTGGGQWQEHKLPENWTIGYQSLTFLIKPMNFKHMGLFPEQASNWDYIAAQVKQGLKALGRPPQVLNLFAYTGAASVAAAQAGAKVTHVDAARGMVAHAKQNAALSGLAPDAIRWMVDDCKAFVAREIRRGKTYDALILDPPSYGRGPGGQVWKLEDDLYDFLTLCLGVLSDTPRFVLLNTYTTGLSAGTLTYILQTLLAERFGGSARAEELGLPVRESGLFLPCGASARWSV